MCNLAQNTVNEAINTFDKSKLVTAIALTLNEFSSSQTLVVIDTMIQDTSVSFIRAIDLIIINKRYGTNSYISSYNGIVGVYSSLYNNGTCRCDCKFTCTEQIMLRINNTMIPINGWYIGCYMIDSLLDSTLECYDDEICINLIYESFPTINFLNDYWNNSIPRPNSLNISQALISRFPLNITIRDCLHEILVDEWNPKINFTNYYQECNPIQCSYILNIRNDLIVVVTTLNVSLLGGLSAALNLIAPISARVLYDIIPEYFRYVQNKVGFQQHISVNRVSVISH